MATVLALHAAVADIPLLTGSTIARLTEEGHRVIAATFTGDEPAAVANSLGAARAENLGHGIDLEASDAAAQLADRVVEFASNEQIDLILGYDSIGVVHEAAHVLVHEVGDAVAERLGAPTVEAAISRELVNRGAQVAKTLRKTVPFSEEQIAQFRPKAELAYDIPTKRTFDRKWDAMKAAGGGSDQFSQLLARGMRFPKLVVSPLFQHEYFGVGKGEAPAFFTALAK
ncbi:hypothetical protein [Gulosibacter sp. 10]|uniref:hypothetical protein n=1 Tax=Gulosibacter sp. 10 TaxID=1255570 RepID=UPI00097E963A|nr:hypothetical protein [Gulosibacter sp. 10]SJM54817.1 Mycothiol conjugate amidase Mca (Mycothiol S-conjugate amidase) [Gulosibacter sp. 10]